MSRRSVFSECLGIAAEAARNQTLGKCSRWAVVRRIMPDGTPYSIADYPYVKAILDSRAKKNWIMKGAQTGLSEAGFTIGFFEIDYHGKDVIYYFPTGKTAERFSKTRFSTAIKASPYLKSVVTTDGLDIKQIGNATLHILGAGSDSNLKSTSAARVILDELDEWTERQIYLAEERLSGQKEGDRITWGLSTPIYPNLGIHKQYLQSTQERYFFDCPHCSETIKLDWVDGFNADDDRDKGSFYLIGDYQSDPAVHASYFKCSECHEELHHGSKAEWLKLVEHGGSGRWVATNPDADPSLSRGFHVSQLYSPTQSPGDIAIKFLRGRGDEAARRLFYNDCLGLPFIEDSHQVNDTHIDEAVHTGIQFSLADPDTIPKNRHSGIYTLGIDQGGLYHSWVAVKWMFDVTRDGDPNDKAIGQLVGLGQIDQDDWGSIHGLMNTWQVLHAVIDYFPEPTNARKFARKFRGAVHLCQYVTGSSGREIRLTEDEHGANLVRCDDTGWMTQALGRLMGGDLDLPLDLPMAFRNHVKVPVRSLSFTGGKYVASYADNHQRPDHYAHALVYAEIALKILNPALHSSAIITKTR
jgi:hypothetical protein